MQIIDVRSPGEYAAGHIPGAVNIPLFSDEERKKIGTLYKQAGPDIALKEGLRIAGEHLPDYLQQGKRVMKNNVSEALIHCWRGGKRSESLTWLFSFSGFSVAQLKGGYKSYRQRVHDFFNQASLQLKILGGCTGAGKTAILHELQKSGQQVIDLEKIAHHKGSAFGAIGQSPQPSNEQFENNLFEAFRHIDLNRPVWLENESRSIGRVYIPEGLWIKMRNAELYHIEVSRDVRLERAIKDYASDPDIGLLKLSFEKIRKRLGGLGFKMAMESLDKGDIRAAALVALQYYDKAYMFQLEQWPKEKVIYLPDCDEASQAAEKLINSLSINA